MAITKWVGRGDEMRRLAGRRGRRRATPEEDIQRAVVRHLRLRGVPGLVWWHCPNGGWRLATEAARLVGLGVRAGVSDLVFLHAGRFHALELKAPGGTVSEAQVAFIDDVREAGGLAAVAVGLDDALARLEGWGLLRPDRGRETKT